MSETNEDLLTYELGNDDPVILNEDELLLSDEEGGIKLDQQDEEFLLIETEEWVSKQLAAKEGEQAAAGSREVARKDARETDEPAAHRHRVRTPVQSVVKQQLDEPVVKNSAVADGESQAPVVVRQNAVPSVERSKPHAKDNVANEVEQSSPAVAVERQDASCVDPSVPTTTEDEVASESTVVHSHEVESAPDLKDVQYTPSRSSQDDGTVASSIYASPERSKAASVSTSPMTSSGGTRNSDRITTASQQCDTTSTEDLLETYTSNQEHDPSYDTDESSEKRGWKNETKSELRHPMQSQSHGQQQLHHGPPGGGMNRGPGQFGKPGMKHPLLPTQQQQAPHSGMGAPSLLGLQGPGFGGPMQHPGARMDFRQGAHRPRFPVRPNFPTDMNPFRGMPGRMNFQQHPGPGMHPGVVGPPGGGHMPQGMGMMGPHRGFPPRGHPRYDMVRPMRPGDHHGFDAGGMRGRPLGAGGGANGPQMFRSNGPPNGPAGGGGAGGPVQGAPGIPVGPNGPYGPGGGPGAPQSVAPIGAAAANAGGPPQSLLSGSFDPMTVGGGSSAGNASNNPILPTPPTVPAFPQKVLINPNFKGGVEAVKNQLMRDAALNSQQFVAGVGAPRVFSDDELLRQQEEFINKNRIEVEKRRHERSPSRERDRERDRDRERERERERDRDRARSRERERSRERDRELREREREREREPRARSRERSRERERERELRPRSRDREREYSPRRHRERAGSRDRDLGRPRRNFPRSRNASRDRDDDGRFPKRRKSGDYGENNRGNHERHDDDEDPETRAYRIEIEKQKATREKMLREKEMRRKRAAEEKLKNKANESKPQENTPPKLTPLVVTEKKIITLKKKSESASDEPRRPADDTRSNSAATVKPTDDHRVRSRPESDQPQSNDGWLASRQRKISEPNSEAIELDLLEELLLREPTPEPMPSRPVLSARETASGGAQVTTTSAPAAVVPATSSSLGGGSGSSSTRDRNNSTSGGGSSRRIVLKPMAEKKERENAASEAHHHHHHHHQQQQHHQSQQHPQGTPSKKSRIFDRLDKRIGVNEADKRKIQRLCPFFRATICKPLESQKGISIGKTV